MLCADLEFSSSWPHPHHHHYTGNPGATLTTFAILFPSFPWSLCPPLSPCCSQHPCQPGFMENLATPQPSPPCPLVILANPPPFLPSSPSLPLLPFPPLPSCPHLSPFPLWAASPPWPPHCPCSQQDCLCQVPVLRAQTMLSSHDYQCYCLFVLLGIR